MLTDTKTSLSSSTADSEKNAIWVNDIHSQLNRTPISRLINIFSLPQLQKEVRTCLLQKQVICLAGGRHAMGGQQFASNAVLFDLSQLDQVLDFDPEKGHLTVEAGIQWPQLVEELQIRQKHCAAPWVIAQKQTGADRLSIGGAVSANIHGRVLTKSPFVSDIEEICLVDSQGELQYLSREKNADLFALVIGGYGLFGIIYSVKLRLIRQTYLERKVEIASIEFLMDKLDSLVESGAIYGDFQFMIDDESDDFLKLGILSTYKPVSENRKLPLRVLSAKKWRSLVKLAHTDKSRAFEIFSQHYLSTDGQTYLSDEFQLANYLDYYHEEIDALSPGLPCGTELITELYVPRERLSDFMQAASLLLKNRKADVIYGTVRLIKADTETFMPWAKEDYACIIFNLHVEHTNSSIEYIAETMRSLIDLAIMRKGSYYLTYHKFAKKEQVETCYPEFAEFLKKKLAYDPQELFQSNWYRHYKTMFAL